MGRGTHGAGTISEVVLSTRPHLGLLALRGGVLNGEHLDRLPLVLPLPHLLVVAPLDNEAVIGDGGPLDRDRALLLPGDLASDSREAEVGPPEPGREMVSPFLKTTSFFSASRPEASASRLKR